MKKTLVIVAAVFLVAIAVGTALGVVLSPGKKGGEATEETAAGSSHVVTAGNGQRSPEPKLPDPHPVTDRISGEESVALSPEGPGSPPLARIHREVSSGESGVEFDELSRILSMLPAQEAALFLDHLENDMALGILRSMTVRQAATVISYCSDAKAAWLKSRLLDLPAEDR